MRTEQEWIKRLHKKVIEEFSPRLQKDFKEIDYDLGKVPAFGSYYIYGGVGSGKTLLAAHMYYQARKKQFLEVLPGKFIFAKTADIFQEIKSTFGKGSDIELEVLKKYCTATYLVMDDIGSTKFTDWQISMLQIIINYRYEELLTTVFTSNLNLDELGTAMDDERIPSRIRRMCEILKKK